MGFLLRSREVWRRDGYNIIPDAFAWYTGPAYVKGTLPAAIEAVLEKMAQGKPEGDNYLLGNKTAEIYPILARNLVQIRKSILPREYETDQYWAGYDIRSFLYVVEKNDVGFGHCE